LVLLVVACVCATVLLPRLPQDAAYHHFVDTRTMLGVRNALNVLSNLPFLLVGVLGWWIVSSKSHFLQSSERWPYAVCFTGVALTAAGSAWYHWSPDNSTLVWDRLPMALAFMGLLAATIAERVSVRLGVSLLAPLIAVGIASVFYWRMTEASGAGDLRPYVLVQFGPAILIPAMALLFPPRYTLGKRYCRILGWYAAAKILEAGDGVIFAAGGVVSGHTLKHLAAAWACYEIARMVELREPI
jgi:hypothetical protein